MRKFEKNVIVTGANRGIGLETVRLFAEQGASVWACARKKNIEFEREMDEIAEKNAVSISPVYFDLESMGEIKKGFETIHSSKKKIDVLVNNAGIGYTQIFPMTRMDDIHRIFQVNTFAAMYLTQLVLKNMMKNRGGCIVNVASTQGVDSSAANCAYGPSKAAIISFTKCLAAETAKFSIRINAVAPGACDTDKMGELKEEEQNYLISKSAMRRLCTPREVAEVILFLASKESGFVNGQVIRVDGGAV